MTFNDRMEQEDIKDVAKSIMEQQAAPSVSVPTPRARTIGRQGVPSGLRESTSQTTGLDLSSLEIDSTPRQASRSLREDLVQQASQSLVKNQVDAFLAVSLRLTPDELQAALNIARQWRRPEAGWQDQFKAAPETGFRFIDRNSPNKAEALAAVVVDQLRERQLGRQHVKKVLDEVLASNGIRLKPQQREQFAAKISRLV